ncbi:MAG TPA: lysylphosphatidylglycerol synthase transmembrane domain-containing protein [Alloprevotella sp.]|nr:lysylphosphatidylglycerol synthase transmembrane domain-containing protein [Alloprevotella sp.]
MKPLYRNLFLSFGILSIFVMLYTFGVDFTELRANLARAGVYLPAVIGVWVIVYAFNAAAFRIIVNSGKHDRHLSFPHAFKLTVSGFAFSYTTPFGFGGGPYRVMELSSYIGTTRAMSSVVLYSMMHILSHICLWASSVVLFIVLYFEKVNSFLWTLFGIFAVILFVVLYFFYVGYKRGMIVKLYSILLHIPFARKYARRFYERNEENMIQIDRNIAYLHEQSRAFYSSLLLEYLARVVNALEYFFILRSLSVPVGFGDSVLILAFSSLLGNLLFFFPMQLGAREGGLAIIIKILGISSPSVGIFTSFYTRIREMVWIFIGVGLVKVGNKSLMKKLPEGGQEGMR